MMNRKIELLFILKLIMILSIYGCSIRKENVSVIHYDSGSRKLLFCIGNDLERRNLKMDIYWRDSLLYSPYIESYDGLDSYFINVFSNFEIGGYNAKSYILDMCYSYSKNGFLPLRYVLVNKDNNSILFDTVLHVSNIVEDEIRDRFNETRKNQYPVIDFEGTGFNYFRYTDYFAFAKGTLYTKGMYNIDERVLMRTANYVDALLNRGYLVNFIPQIDSYSRKVVNRLSIHVPDSIPKVYLLLTSLSGGKDAKDFSFEISQEISDFVGKEYAFGFENATINSSEYLRVPIRMIGNHKYNFIQVLFVVYILANNDYKYIPVGYILTRNLKEVQEFGEEDNLVKYIVSPAKQYYIGKLFLINYNGKMTLY